MKGNITIFLLIKFDIIPVRQQGLGVHHCGEHNCLWTKVSAGQTQGVEYFSEQNKACSGSLPPCLPSPLSVPRQSGCALPLLPQAPCHAAHLDGDGHTGDGHGPGAIIGQQHVPGSRIIVTIECLTSTWRCCCC